MTHTTPEEGRIQMGAVVSICATDWQNTLPGSFVTKQPPQCPTEPSSRTKLFLPPEFTDQSISPTTERNCPLTPIAGYRVKIPEEY